MENSSILLLLTIFLFSSCHFHDDRVVVTNAEGQELLFAIAKLDPKERTDILSPFFSLKPQQKKAIYLLRNLDYNDIEGDSVTILQISPEDEKSVLRENGYYEYEQILQEEKYSYLNVALKEIVEEKVKIVYTKRLFHSGR
ncbi:MAG: hypothetical protein AAGG75_25970 [Bacteroidota bacterium]